MRTNAYHDKMDAKKEKIQAKIQELKARAKEVSADVRITIDRQLRELREQMKS